MLYGTHYMLSGGHCSLLPAPGHPAGHQTWRLLSGSQVWRDLTTEPIVLLVLQDGAGWRPGGAVQQCGGGCGRLAGGLEPGQGGLGGPLAAGGPAQATSYL